MLNLVEKYSAETAEVAEDGVVAIEYVVLAAAIVGALTVLWATGVFGALNTKLAEIISSI
jgi:hypothetical protein